MRPNLDYYMASVDGWPFEVGVDMTHAQARDNRELPYRAHLRLELNHPTEDGLCTAEEEALLVAVQGEILSSLDPRDNRLVAVVTHRNARTLVFYMRTKPEGEHPVLHSLDSVQTHATKVLFEEDPDWSEYREFLFPDENLRHQIRDRQILREFERRGDDCSEVHSIEPRFVLGDEVSARKLASSLEGQGFGVKEIEACGKNGDSTWHVIGSAMSPLGLAILDEFRPKWLDLASEAGGRYDGWSAELIPVSGANNNHGAAGHLSGKAEDYQSSLEPKKS